MAAPLPKLSLSDGLKPDAIDAPKIVAEWVSTFNQALQEKKLPDVAHLFLDDCWWRDIVSVSWDFSTKHGKDAIFDYLNNSTTGFGQLKVVTSGALVPMFIDMGGMQWVQSGFDFQTSAGSGKGILRLANVGPTDWRAWVVLTQLDELKSYAKQDGDDLQVLVIGAGSSE